VQFSDLAADLPFLFRAKFRTLVEEQLNIRVLYRVSRDSGLRPSLSLESNAAPFSSSSLTII
jgi:hypothetical protein